MALKKLLFFDLRRLFPGAKKREAQEERNWEDLWFVAPFVWIRGGKVERRPFYPLKQAPGGAGRPLAPLPDVPYKPGLYYRGRIRRIRYGRWAGPVYWSSRHWREDLCRVLSEVTSIVRTNGPLPDGLGAVAREERRHLGFFSSKRWMALIQALVWIACTTVFALFFASAIQKLLDGILSWHVPRRDSEDLAMFIAAIAGLIPGALGALHILFSLGRREAVYLALRDYLWNGMQLSEAMAEMPRFFPPLYADMARAGEESGSLLRCLEQLDEDTLNLISFRAYVRSQFIYLGLVFLAQIVLVAFITLKVLPVFAEILRDFDQQGPAVFMLSIGIADEFVYNWPYYVPLLGILIGIIVRKLWPNKRSLATGRVSGLIMLIPGVGTLVMRHNVATLSVILGKLLEAGAPLPTALKSAARSDLSGVYVRLLHRVTARIEQGDTVAAAVARERRLLPAAFREMAAVGERSGMLAEAFSNLAENYRQGLERFNRIVADLVTPVGIAALGLINLTIEAAVFASIAGIVDGIMAGM